MVKILKQEDMLPAVTTQIDPARLELDYVCGIIVNGTRVFPTASQLARYYNMVGSEQAIVKMIEALDLDNKRIEYLSRMNLPKSEYIDYMDELAVMETAEIASYLRSMFRSSLKDGDQQSTIIYAKLASMWTELSMSMSNKGGSDIFSKWKDIWENITKIK